MLNLTTKANTFLCDMTILNKIYTAISRELQHVQKIPRDLLEEEDFFKKAWLKQPSYFRLQKVRVRLQQHLLFSFNDSTQYFVLGRTWL